MHRGDFRPETRRVNFSAFMPNKNGKTSIYKSSTLQPTEIREIARKYVEPHRGPPRGHADVAGCHIGNLGLSVEDAPFPHPLHANIVGWGDDNSINRITAQKLAERAELTIWADAS